MKIEKNQIDITVQKTEGNNSIRFKKVCLAIDLFGRPFQFRMMHGYTSHRSIVGSFFSVILLVIALAFSASKLNTLLSRQEPKLKIWQKEHFLDNTYEFNMKDSGYSFAFGVMHNNAIFG